MVSDIVQISPIHQRVSPKSSVEESIKNHINENVIDGYEYDRVFKENDTTWIAHADGNLVSTKKTIRYECRDGQVKLIEE